MNNQINSLFTPHSQQNFARVMGYFEPHSWQNFDIFGAACWPVFDWSTDGEDKGNKGLLPSCLDTCTKKINITYQNNII